MDSARLQLLQELMKEARTTGELESSLAATSVMPVPKRPNRKNVPLADFNRTVAAMAKPGAVVPPPGIQASGIQAVPKGSTLLADVPASSNAPPMSARTNATDGCTDADKAGIYGSNESRDFTRH